MFALGSAFVTEVYVRLFNRKSMAGSPTSKETPMFTAGSYSEKPKGANNFSSHVWKYF